MKPWTTVQPALTRGRWRGKVVIGCFRSAARIARSFSWWFSGGGLGLEVHLAASGDDHILVTAPELDAQFEVWGNCPVQAIGTVLGRDMYFRARHGSWTFDVADLHGNLPSDGQARSDGFYREGEYANAGWMALTDAVKITTRCLEDYTGGTALKGAGWPNPITRNLDG